MMTGQTTLKGNVSADGMPLPLANVVIKTLKNSTVSDSEGNFEIINFSKGTYEIQVSYTGFRTNLFSLRKIQLQIFLKPCKT